MAANDLRVYSTRSGGGGNRQAFPMAASAAFREGEPVVFTAAGFIDEAGSDPAAIAGIASMRATDVDGNSNAAGTPITIELLDDDTLMQTVNFATLGAGALVTPTLANASGELAGLILTGGGAWVLDTGAGNLPFRIEKVLDASGQELGQSNLVVGDGATVVFRRA